MANIPVINQDLTASGFTPVTNTYYRHTGATTDTFTQGVIYLYDTAYHKLGESGGGTTLNEYTWSIKLNATITQTDITRLINIIKTAKGRVMGEILNNGITYFLYPSLVNYGYDIGLHGTCVKKSNNEYYVIYHKVEVNTYPSTYIIVGYDKMISNTNGESYRRDDNNPSNSPLTDLHITYYNDTEIT